MSAHSPLVLPVDSERLFATDDFLPEDYSFTADLLRQHAAANRRDLFQAVCSNNLNIILAALDKAGAEEPTP